MNKDLQGTVNERIGLLVQHFAAGNKTAFAKAVGISSQSVAEILGGRYSAPSFVALNKIGNVYPEVQMDWLVMGRGNMLKEKNAISPEEIQQENSAEKLRSELLEAQERNEKRFKTLFDAMDAMSAHREGIKKKQSRLIRHVPAKPRQDPS